MPIPEFKAVDQFAAAVAAAIASAPPLTDDIADRLAAVLARGGDE